MAEEKRSFQAEVAKLLDIVVHSLYSNREIFLRELVSNAADACDKLRYAALTQPDLIEGQPDFRIRLEPDKEKRVLTVADNGIGMNRDDLVENLGTIARSGTAEFLSRLSGDARKDVTLIGQFGVGFYSAFMVAGRVEVITRKAGETQGWRWASDGQGEFTIAPHDVPERGTRVVLHLRDGMDEYLEPATLKRIVKTYSDHIPQPIVLAAEGKEETLNTASALWTRPKGEITEEQYREFYHHVAHAFDDPWLTLHYKAEGAIEYTALLFVPSQKPFDIFHPERRPQVKLYVKRVFITDDCEELLPPYLRFLRGVVDSEDLPLNISRELLQHNPVLAKIRSGLVKRVLGELKKKAEKAPEEYAAFWDNFGAVLKEGLYEDFERRDDLLELARFHTTAGGGPVSLKTYIERMKEGQEAIYTITGDDIEALRRSPQLEGFVARGIEVLLLTDPVDEFWIPAVGSYQDKPFRSVAEAGDEDLDKIKAEDKDAADQPEPAPEGAVATLVAAFKQALDGQVKDVRASHRLTESAVCLVADQGEMSLRLERLLRQHQQLQHAQPRILEINPRHPLIKRLAEAVQAKGADHVADAAHLLLDQARITEGETLPDPAGFAKRLASALEKGLA